VNIGPVIAVGHDKANDLALLKLNASITAEPLPLSIAAVRLGEEVIAVGYPLQGILASERLCKRPWRYQPTAAIYRTSSAKEFGRGIA
jgi:hypothetical protein